MSRTNSQGLTSLDIALQWAQLPPEHLKVALKALEPQLARLHDFALMQARLEHELRLEELRGQEAQAARSHRLYLLGLIAGFLASAGMLGGAVVLGVSGQPWLSALFAGPSLLALATIFVLRRNDGAQAKAVERASRTAANVATQVAVGPQPQAPAAP